MKSFFVRVGFVPFALLAAIGCSSNNTNNGGGGTDAGVDQAATDTPATDTPATDAPATDAPATDTPATDGPAPDVPRPDGGMPSGGTAVVSYLFDAQRTGANTHETRLTPAALRGGGFARDMGFTPQTTGEIYSQPLYMPGLMVGGAAHDVLFVATQANNVYALDAATGAELWNINLGPTVSRSQQSCGNINTIGVTSTGVIDSATRTLYVVNFTSDGGLAFKLNALDVTTGMQRSGYPVAIRPPAVGSSSFDTRTTGQRGALSFRNGTVYVPFGGLYGDCGIYHGWVVAIDASTPATQRAFATPGRGSGIWAPAGMSMDAMGRIFVATGNSTPLSSSTPGSLGEFVLRLGTGSDGPSFAMDDMAAQFSPSDARNLDLQDLDIGSVAPVVLPGSPNRVVQGGKAGTVYLLDGDNLGGTSPVFSSRVCSGGIFGAMAAWSNGTDTFAFVPARGTRSGCGGSNGVMALRVSGGSMFTAAWCSASVAAANPPAVSSNGNNDGVLWVTGASTGLGSSPVLRAYEIATGMEVYANTAPPPSVRQWVPPVVADGRVYVTGASSVYMYRVQ